MAEPIRTLPPAPRPADSPTVFNGKSFSWVDALAGWTGDVNALVAWMNAYVDRYQVYPIIAAESTVAESLSGGYIRLTSDATKTVIVGEIEDLEVGTFWNYANVGSSDVTFVSADDITLIPPAGGTLVVPQNGVVSLVYEHELTYRLIGLTVAA